MALLDYKFTIEQCDVPVVRHAKLREYRSFRRKCLETIRGDSDSSIMNQVHDLAWHTAVFRTLNEARRLEPERVINGAMWELITAGYASLMTLGIRRLVDQDSRTISVWSLIESIERRPELLDREMFVCYDGLAFDPEPARKRYMETLSPTTGAQWLPTTGPESWSTSDLMQRAFDALAPQASKRKRADTILPSILTNLKTHLTSPSIRKVCTMADKCVAHAERLAEGSAPVPIASYNEIDEALEQIVRVANFLSSRVFYDATFGAVVPTPQFDVTDGLDEPWVTTANLPLLHQHWKDISHTMDQWAYRGDDDLMRPNPSPT